MLLTLGPQQPANGDKEGYRRRLESGEPCRTIWGGNGAGCCGWLSGERWSGWRQGADRIGPSERDRRKL